MNRRQMFRLLPAVAGAAAAVPLGLAGGDEVVEFETLHIEHETPELLIGFAGASAGPYQIPHSTPDRFTVTITEPSGRQHRFLKEK
ncbi:hypothetical protein LCGC14_1440290 [marine sediment metagenome]|uniref:Uncharacterized protein n=1 Tax=marine sediment metagenome TaxID=412755 RepID=A0A0F9JKV7_9ZZZZ